MVEMLQAFIGGFFQVFTATTFTLMILGIAIGFAVGILPGLGGAVTLALMLPFVYKMDATEAFAFLLGMSAVTATTGDITSILFGIFHEYDERSRVLGGCKKVQAGYQPSERRGSDKDRRRVRHAEPHCCRKIEQYLHTQAITVYEM